MIITTQFTVQKLQTIIVVMRIKYNASPVQNKCTSFTRQIDVLFTGLTDLCLELLSLNL